MLKGEVFAKQLFENQIFALFINTFLNGKNGVSNNYKNSMAVTYSGSNVTVDSGAVCIQGRFLEEDTSTTLAAGTDTMFCKLVIEIDLDKTNTAEDFQQGAYKIIKNASAYPTLTQTNIVKNNAGIYQYELARFKTTSGGIIDFQDMRTFLDFESIYDEIEQHIQDIDDGSIYVLKEGSTLTGPLVFDNTEAVAVEKNRTVDGDDYKLIMSITDQKTGAINFSKNGTQIAGLEQKTTGLYNSVTNKKLIEEGTTNIQYTFLGQYFPSASSYPNFSVTRVGNMCVINFEATYSALNASQGVPFLRLINATALNDASAVLNKGINGVARVDIAKNSNVVTFKTYTAITTDSILVGQLVFACE